MHPISSTHSEMLISLLQQQVAAVKELSLWVHVQLQDQQREDDSWRKTEYLQLQPTKQQQPNAISSMIKQSQQTPALTCSDMLTPTSAVHDYAEYCSL